MMWSSFPLLEYIYNSSFTRLVDSNLTCVLLGAVWGASRDSYFQLSGTQQTMLKAEYADFKTDIKLAF